MTFPLDINKPGYPLPVLEAIAKDQLLNCWRDWQLPLPLDAKIFLTDHVPDSGYEWESALMAATPEMSDELLEQWVNALRSGLVRAEMRALLKQRKEHRD